MIQWNPGDGKGSRRSWHRVGYCAAAPGARVRDQKEKAQEEHRELQTVSFQKRLAAVAFLNFLLDFSTLPLSFQIFASQFVLDMFQFRFSAHLRTLVYESSSLWCESWELSDALCDLRRSSLLMALRELGYWQGAKWQHKILPNFYIILSYPQNSWLMAAWRYPVDRKSWEIWGIWQAAPQGSLTTKLPWTRLAHLPVLTDQNDVLVECII